MPDQKNGRRRFLQRALAAGGALLLSGCDQLSRSNWFTRMLDSAEKLTFGAQRLLLPRKAMAQEFTAADLSPDFRSNGTSNPANPLYQALAANRFADYRLQVGGLVAQPRTYSLDDLKALPSRTQITRHDCVEGWSAIGKWGGVSFGSFLRQVGADLSAKYVGFKCADDYFTSIDMPTALHPQTVLALTYDGQPLPPKYGFPMKLRMPTKLGYKNPKHIQAIFVTNTYPGGYWEDQGYNWFGGS